MFNLFKKKTESEKPQLDQVLAKLNSLMKPTWLPDVRDGDTDLTGSKFSGLPWLSESEDWPCCPNCNQPMQLFVQLNLAQLPSLPDKCPQTGLVQLFYCTSSEPLCECDCEAYFPGAESVFARLVQPTEAGQSLRSSPVVDSFPPKHVIGWAKKDDYPNGEEMQEHGVNLTNAEFEALDELQLPIGGEKLMGWPAWVQGLEYPDCPNCGTRMHFLFQIDSESNIPYMFGDVGCGHITQCPQHPEQLAFGWACS